MRAYSFKIRYCLFVLFLPLLLYPKSSTCSVPHSIKNLISNEGVLALKHYPDVARKCSALKGLCTYLLSFHEGAYQWDMLLVLHPKKRGRAFWFLPHDNENSAFDAAVYAVQKYGGGFLSVLSDGKRYHQGQDPNRNFAKSRYKLRSCKAQKASSSRYTKIVFKVIDTFKGPNMPYLALHNNINAGSISILKSSKKVKSYPAYPLTEIKKGRGLKDEDSLVYIAGKSDHPPVHRLQALLSHGINVKYEVVNQNNNDCSMSNYVVLNKKADYYNIEVQHGDLRTQKKMIDILMEYVMK